MFNAINNSLNEQFLNYSRIFKDAEKNSRTTRCFSRIKDIARFQSKFKDSPWRSRTSGNLRPPQGRHQDLAAGGAKTRRRGQKPERGGHI